MSVKDYYIVRGTFIGPNAFKVRKGTALMGGYKATRAFVSDGGSMSLEIQTAMDTERFGQYFPAFLAHDAKFYGLYPDMTFKRANDEFMRDLIDLGMRPDKADFFREMVQECGTDHWDASPRRPKNKVWNALSNFAKYLWRSVFVLVWVLLLTSCMVFAGCQSAPKQVANSLKANSALETADTSFVEIDGTAEAIVSGEQEAISGAKMIRKAVASGRGSIVVAVEYVTKMLDDINKATARADKWEKAYHSRPAQMFMWGMFIGVAITIIGVGGAFGLAATIPLLSFAAGAVGRRIAMWGAIITGVCGATYEAWPYRWWIWGGSATLALLIVGGDLWLDAHRKSVDMEAIDAIEGEILKDATLGAEGFIDYKDPATIKYARLRLSKRAFERWTKLNKID